LVANFIKMKYKFLESLTFWWIVSFVLMLLATIGLKINWDKQDWIFIFLFVGFIVLNVKLNKLLSKNKKS